MQGYFSEASKSGGPSPLNIRGLIVECLDIHVCWIRRCWAAQCGDLVAHSPSREMTGHEYLAPSLLNLPTPFPSSSILQIN